MTTAADIAATEARDARNLDATADLSALDHAAEERR